MRAEIPTSTYRLQFNPFFTFNDALRLVPYLGQLGISHCYASPLLTARPGSTHGYDIIDHSRLNPEIGTQEEFDAWVEALHAHGIGLILDIVPNHMGIGEDNAWWMDVLENGPASRYASYFDIDWAPLKPELAMKVLLPVLGDPYGSILERGELQVRFDAAAGTFSVYYHDHHWPVTPQSYPMLLRYNLEALRHALNMAQQALGPKMLSPVENPSGAPNETQALPEEASLEASFSMAFLEYESILRSFEQLPPHTEREPQRIQERDREVMVAKRRLAKLCQENSAIETFLCSTLDVFNSVENNREHQDLLHQLLEAQVYRLAYWRVAGEEINYRRFFDINDLAGICTENPDVFRDTHALVLKLVQQGKVQGLRIDHPDGLFDPAAYFQRLQMEAARAMKQSHLNLQRSETATDPAKTADNVALDSVTPGEALQEPDSESTTPVFERDNLPFYVLAEKILASFEHLPRHWAVHGTTGYDFTQSLTGVFVQQASQARITRIYERFTGLDESFSDILLACKRLTLKVAMSSELNVLAHQLDRLSESDRRSRDFTVNGLRRALAEVVAAFPVYRTYLDEHPAGSPSTNASAPKDREFVEWAVSVAKKRSTGLDLGIFDFIRSLLLADLTWIHPSAPVKAVSSKEPLLTDTVDDLAPAPDADVAAQAAPVAALSAAPLNEYSAFEAAVRRFAMKFQQLSGPVMAKSMEDTAFYRYNRLVSLNEVGCQPELFGLSVSAFHHHNQERARHWPYAMLATSTHDTKRSEDVRARLNVLSEIPQTWQYALMKWSRLNRIHKTVVQDKHPENGSDNEHYPSRNDEYLLYQTLCGIFPFGVTDWSDDQIAVDLNARLKAAMQKAVREAKVYTSWINPNEAYENALFKFIDALLSSKPKNPFRDEFLAVLNVIAQAGSMNSLAQLVLKLTVPGVPDIYQGMELPTFSLVDPDNRRAVDYGLRLRLLEDLEPLLNPENPLEHSPEACEERLQRMGVLFSSAPDDERLKLFLTTATLRFRKQNPQLFLKGTYTALSVTGQQADRVIAFARQYGEQTIVVVVSRFWASCYDKSYGKRVSQETSTEPAEQTITVAEAQKVITPTVISSHDWKDTVVELPNFGSGSLENAGLAPQKQWVELYTGKITSLGEGAVPLAKLLPFLPVSVWILTET